MRRFVSVLTFLGCLAFVLLGLYLYLFKSAPLQLLVLVLLSFGAGVVISLVSLISERETWTIDVANLSKAQRFALGGSGIAVSVGSLWIVLTFALPTLFNIILIVGVALLARWSLKLLL